MAKQSGIHQLRGKIRGMSYYGQKGVQDGLVRKINEGLSTRVKNDAAYANTRLNAAEFGTAGSFAGAAIRSISERKRSMMKDFATGDLAKVVRAEFLKDDTHVWGKRQFVGGTWRGLVADKLNQYAKLSWADYVQAAVESSYVVSESDSSLNTSISAGAGWGGLLAAKGATSVSFEGYLISVGFDNSGDAPYRSTANAELLFAQEGSLSEELSINESVMPTDPDPGIQDNNEIKRVLIVAKPMKEIASQKYVLQELCTYILVDIN